MEGATPGLFHADSGWAIARFLARPARSTMLRLIRVDAQRSQAIGKLGSPLLRPFLFLAFLQGGFLRGGHHSAIGVKVA